MSFLEPFGEEINPFTACPFRRETLDDRIARLRPGFVKRGYIFEHSPRKTPNAVHGKNEKDKSSVAQSSSQSAKIDSISTKRPIDILTPELHAKNEKNKSSVAQASSQSPKIDSISTKRPNDFVTPELHGKNAKEKSSLAQASFQPVKMDLTSTKRPTDFVTPEIHAKNEKDNSSVAQASSQSPKIDSTSTKRPNDFVTPELHGKNAKDNSSVAQASSQFTKIDSTSTEYPIGFVTPERKNVKDKSSITPPSSQSIKLSLNPKKAVELHSKNVKDKSSITPSSSQSIKLCLNPKKAVELRSKNVKDKSLVASSSSQSIKIVPAPTKRPSNSVDSKNAKAKSLPSTSTKRIKLEFKHSFNFIDDNAVLDENFKEEKKRHRAIFRHCEGWVKDEDRKKIYKELSPFTKAVWPNPRKITKEDKVTVSNINEFLKKDVFQMMLDAALNNPNLFECHENIYAKENKHKIKRSVVKKRKFTKH